MLNNSNVSNEHLQDKIVEPRIFKAYKKLETEKRWTDGYFISVMGYNGSSVRDFESYLRIAVGLAENDIQLILKQNNLSFLTYEIPN